MLMKVTGHDLKCTVIIKGITWTFRGLVIYKLETS